MKYNTQERNKEMYGKRKQGWTYGRLAVFYGLSRARIAEICKNESTPWFTCEKHNRKYKVQCRICGMIEKYEQDVKLPADIELEMKRLQKPGRTLERVVRLKLLIKYLRDTKKLTYSAIARLLKRDRTTIMHHYVNM